MDYVSENQSAKKQQVWPKFGTPIEYAEPSWYQGVPSPYYRESHVQWRSRVRTFVETEIKPFVSEWEEKESVPVKAICKKMVEAGLYGPSYPKEYGGDKSGIPDYDAFHSLIFTDEWARIGSGGVAISFTVGLGIGLGPVIMHGSEALKNRIVPGILSADKFICLAITEPQAGSDVSGIQTTAKLDPTGKFYIVNGTKKFITAAAYSDYFTTAVKTEKGFSVLLIEKTEGVTVRRLKTQGWLPSNTGFIIFENVKVPKENLLGIEGNGFQIIMSNFNGERFGAIVQAIRLARLCYEEAITYAHKRETFGQPLWSNQLIRSKVAGMVRRIESCFTWAESLAFAMQNGSRGSVAGQLALLKVQSTQAFEYCAREASQIFGGASFLRSGPGEKVERLYREVRVLAIGGGSEEVMDELAMRRLKYSKL